MAFYDKKTITSIYIDIELKEKVSICAKNEKRNTNNYIIMAIENQVKKDLKKIESE